MRNVLCEVGNCDKFVSGSVKVCQSRYPNKDVFGVLIAVLNVHEPCEN